MYRILCAWQNKKLSVAKPSYHKTLLPVWGLYSFIIESINNFLNQFLFSACSGIVVSGYSKTLTDKSLLTHLAKDIDQYKKYKKMYKVDATEEFKG